LPGAGGQKRPGIRWFPVCGGGNRGPLWRGVHLKPDDGAEDEEPLALVAAVDLPMAGGHFRCPDEAAGYLVTGCDPTNRMLVAW